MGGFGNYSGIGTFDHWTLQLARSASQSSQKMLNKKAIVTSPADLTKGFFIGFIIGALLIFLGAKKIIPLPFL